MYTTDKLVSIDVTMCISLDMLSEDVKEAIFDVWPQDNEPLEFWFVTEWLANKLEEQGESVCTYGWHHIWLRTTSGQSISMDYCINQIVKEFNKCFHS